MSSHTATGSLVHEAEHLPLPAGIAALEGYEGANALALRQWEKVYPDGALRVALTDTFSTKREYEGGAGSSRHQY